jgi:hypothetical protein
MTIEPPRLAIDKKPIIALPTTETEHSEKNLLLGTQSSGAFQKLQSNVDSPSHRLELAAPATFLNKTPGTMIKPPKPPEALKPKRQKSPKGVNGLGTVIPYGATLTSPLNPQVQLRWAEPSALLDRLMGKGKNDRPPSSSNGPPPKPQRDDGL